MIILYVHTNALMQMLLVRCETPYPATPVHDDDDDDDDDVSERGEVRIRLHAGRPDRNADDHEDLR